MTKSPPGTIATLKAITEAFNAHDLDAILEFLAEDCSMDMPRGCDQGTFRDGKVTRKDSYWKIIEQPA